MDQVPVSTRQQVKRLYFGSDDAARRFRRTLLVFDLLLLGLFILGTFVERGHWQNAIDMSALALLGGDFAARLWIAENKALHFRKALTWADIAVIASLLLPIVIDNLLFLRVLRAMRLFHSYHVMRDLREEFEAYRRNEEMIDAMLNLIVFIIVTAAIVFVLQGRTTLGINNYVDALYFTVSTLTTTGFGDIVMRDTQGRLLAVGIMLVGYSLFLRMAQAIFRPRARRYECPDCGLTRHDFDASHCKHCGRVVTATHGDDDLG